MTVKDPVCGMTIDTDSAPARSSYEGTTYYFCSDGCKKAFDALPSRFAGDPHIRTEPRFTRAGGIPAPKFGFAGSGGAEYEPRQKTGSTKDRDE